MPALIELTGSWRTALSRTEGCPSMDEPLSLTKRLRGVLRALGLRGPLADDPTARLFHGFLLSLFCWLAVWTAILGPLYPNPPARLGAGVIQLVSPLGSLLLLRLGFLRRASLFYLTGSWIFATYVVAFNDGIRGPFLAHYVVLPILASWLIGFRGALWCIVASASGTLAFAIIDMLGVDLPQPYATTLGIWAVYMQVFLTGSLPVAQILRRLRDESIERQRREQALRESEERFRRVFEEGPLGLALVGKDYRFLKVNSALCQIVGYSEASLLQMTFADITYPDDLRANVELAQRLFVGEIPLFTLRKRYVKKNGEIIWINLTASVIRNQQGEPMYGLAMIEDITEVTRAREIENQLASELAASRDEIRALAASLIRAQEDERRKVSRELHDQICQQLGFLASDIRNLTVSPLAPENLRDQLTAIRARVVKTSQEIHDIAYQMHTAILNDLGLVASLKALCRQFSDQNPDMAVDYENSGPLTSIPSEVATCLYRVAQASLQNVAKHSGAKNVSLRLGFKEGAIVLTIQDDGAGFDTKAVKGHGGIGLISMQERAYSVNGELTITSQPGHGTQIFLEIPLPESRV